MEYGIFDDFSDSVTLTDVFGLNPISRQVSRWGDDHDFGTLGPEVVTSLLTFGKSIDGGVTTTYSWL